MVFLGDGAFDGTRLQHTVEGAGWSYVCRTGCHRTAWWDGETFRLDTLGACSKPGTLVALSEVWFTRAEYGPIMLISYGSPIFTVVHKNWYPASYRALTQSPIAPESAAREGAERSHIAQSGVAP